MVTINKNNMATDVIISASSESGFIKVYINDEDEAPTLILDHPGTTTVSLASGTHNLTYFVQGRVGQQYAVKITDPPNVVWTDRDTIDNDGKVAGQHRIRL